MARSRTTAPEMAALAIADLTNALTAAGLSIERTSENSLRIALDDSAFDVDVVPVAYATASNAAELIAETSPPGHVAVLVADRVTAHARSRLIDAGWGWLDRRGHLRLRGPGLLVDTAVSTATRGARTPEAPLRGRAGLAIAYQLLTRPEEPISPTRSGLGFAPSTVSEALKRLRTGGLVQTDGHPVLPEFFWALAEEWAPQRTWLAEEPSPTATETAGWCVSGTLAAAELGAPIVAAGSTPDLYVPGPVVITIATRRYGVARDASVAAASIAVAPVSAVTGETRPPVHQRWRLAHPVAVALDLAQDRARGREILEDWSPSERVW